jgi:hypothetical protein
MQQGPLTQTNKHKNYFNILIISNFSIRHNIFHKIFIGFCNFKCDEMKSFFCIFKSGK